MLKKLIFVLIACFAITLISCVEQKILKPSVPFDLVETQHALRDGDSTITGQAFLKTVGGDVKYGAGSTVILIPYTRYVEETVNLRKTAGPFDRIEGNPEVMKHTKKTVADGSGKFKFVDLAPGKYLLESEITWGVPNQYGGINKQGGSVNKVVAIENDGDTVEIMLTL